MKYNMLEVIGEKKENNRTYWLCRCDCSNEKWIRADSIKSGNSVSCGCQQKSKPKNLSGKRFGRLVAIRPIEQKKYRNIVWECKCDCGNTTNVSSSNLIAGHIQSCGCLASDISKKTIKEAVKVTKENIVENTNIFLIQKEKPNANNTSGYRGVTYDKRGNKWIAQIQFKKRLYYLGRYNAPKKASEAYEIAKEKLHGEFLEWYENEYKKIKKQSQD